MIFLYKSFFVNYILSFSLVGLWTIRLLDQVYRHRVKFRLRRRGYDNHNCHNKPQIGNGLELEWRHARKRWAENLGILKNTSVESWLWASRVGSLLGTSPVSCRMETSRVGSRLWPCRRTVKVKFRPRCWEVEVWPWSSVDLYRQSS